ncbi:MAG: hypothetical protein GW789_08640 [Ignavibacteria bacterium]|nr:hypothetical protein [Ignavibacteria bacterium]
MENIKLFCFNSKTVNEISTAVRRSARRIIMPPKNIATNICSDRLLAMLSEYIPSKKFDVVISPPTVKATALSIANNLKKTDVHPAKTKKTTRITTE